MYTPISTLSMDDPFRQRKSTCQMVGLKCARDTIPHPKPVITKKIRLEEDFVYKLSSEGPRRCISIQANRWKTENALDITMMMKLTDLMKKYMTDSFHTSIVWRSRNGVSDLCTGLDITYLYKVLKEGSIEKARQIYKIAFETAYKIYNLEKPFITALIGEVTGVGAGLALSGYPLTTGTTQLSFPGTGLGALGVDCGLSFKMSRLPKNIGIYYMVSGKKIHSCDVYHLGLAYLNSQADFIESMESTLSLAEVEGDYQAVINLALEFHMPVEPSTVLKYQDSIDRCFSKDTVQDIIEELKKETKHVEWAKNTLERMQNNSPLAMEITLRLGKLARFLSYEDCLNLEYAIICRLLQHQEYLQGLFSYVEGRHRNWIYSKPSNVNLKEVQSFFGPLPDKLKLDLTKLNPYAVRKDLESINYRSIFHLDNGEGAYDLLNENIMNKFGGPFGSLEQAVGYLHTLIKSPKYEFAYENYLNHEEKRKNYMKNITTVKYEETNHVGST